MVLRLRLLTLRMLERLKHQREAGADDGGGQAQAAGGAAERRLTAAGAAAMTSPEPYVPMQELINAYAKCFFHALSLTLWGTHDRRDASHLRPVLAHWLLDEELANILYQIYERFEKR